MKNGVREHKCAYLFRLLYVSLVSLLSLCWHFYVQNTKSIRFTQCCFCFLVKALTDQYCIHLLGLKHFVHSYVYIYHVGGSCSMHVKLYFCCFVLYCFVSICEKLLGFFQNKKDFLVGSSRYSPPLCHCGWRVADKVLE